MNDHTASAPPSPPPPPPARAPTLSGVALDDDTHGGLVLRVRRLERITLDHRGILGRAPNPMRAGDRGEGLVGGHLETREALTAILDELKSARELAERRGGWAARIGWRALDTLIPLVLLAGLAWATGHIR